MQVKRIPKNGQLWDLHGILSGLKRFLKVFVGFVSGLIRCMYSPAESKRILEGLALRGISELVGALLGSSGVV